MTGRERETKSELVIMTGIIAPNTRPRILMFQIFAVFLISVCTQKHPQESYRGRIKY